MDAMTKLKYPIKDYPVRLAQFMAMVETVKAQSPDNRHLWEVMDSVAFEDTEAALQTALYNSRHVGRSR